jgi:phosphomethylpyrimidine synthase
MSKARQELDWETIFDLAIDSEKARRYRKESTPEHEDTCTMCGKMCAVRNMNKVMQGKNLNILREDS